MCAFTLSPFRPTPPPPPSPTIGDVHPYRLQFLLRPLKCPGEKSQGYAKFEGQTRRDIGDAQL